MGARALAASLAGALVLGSLPAISATVVGRSGPSSGHVPPTRANVAAAGRATTGRRPGTGSADRGDGASSPTVAVTWPPSGTSRSGSTASDLVSWSASAADEVDLAADVSDQASPNVDCAATSWRAAWSVDRVRSPFQVTDLLPGRCYRYRVTARSAAGHEATATSGTLWARPAWTGGVDLYRPGVFATQATMTWCVPAAVQMVLNIADDRTVRTVAEQSELYAYGRTQDYADYAEPGLDPQATVALLARAGESYVNDRAATVDELERESALAMRLTGKPVILYVDHAVHAWVLVGYTATADPADGMAYTITSLSVMGPLWPMQQRYKRFYDLPPDTRLSPSVFAAAIGAPFHEAIPTPWEGTWVATIPR